MYNDHHPNPKIVAIVDKWSLLTYDTKTENVSPKMVAIILSFGHCSGSAAHVFLVSSVGKMVQILQIRCKML